MTGKIIKGIGGFYYVSAEGKLYTCKAKGICRLENVRPMIGDEVELSVIDADRCEGSIDEILPRRNSLLRPAVSNIDIVLVVQALAKPKLQPYLLDRFLLSMEMRDIPIGIIWNKADLCREIPAAYRDYPGILTSAKTGEGIDAVRACIRGKSAALAGPSGVGKSSITNLLCPEALMETGGISRKIERGKHTTRHSEFFALGEDTFLCDTPGFTSVVFEDIPSDRLKYYFRDFAPYEGKCRFHGCMHLAEPECAVKQALEDGNIAESRYDSYTKIYDEIYHQERRYP